ncbi:MAG: energy transducer TonB [Planctomycetia bacterium]|nr:energy transducer TonB [Planctomycetia bacterium]
MFVVRDYLFGVMLCLSALCHATAAFCLARVEYEPPRLIAPQEGRASVRIRASVQAQAQPKQPVPPTETKPLPPELPAALVQIEDLPEPPPSALPLPRPAPSRLHTHQEVQVRPTEPLPTEGKTAEKSSTASRPSEASAGARVDELPRDVVTNPAPPYPPAALAARQEGTVWLRVKVDATGLVTAISLYESSQVAILDEAALSTVRRWRFHPARRNGVAVACEFLKPIAFSLRRLP